MTSSDAPSRPGPYGERRGGWDGLAEDVVAAAVALLRRDGTLDPDEVAVAIDAVAGMTDALASVSDHLSHRLKTPHGEPGEVIEDLYRARDALIDASSRARHARRSLRRPGP